MKIFLKLFHCLFLILLLVSSQSFAKYGLNILDKNEYKNLPKTEKYRSFLPSQSDLSEYMPPVGHQGFVGSCAAWSTNYAARSYYQLYLDESGIIFSPSFVYDYLNKESNCSNGLFLNEVLDFMKYTGSISIDDYPIRQESCILLPQFNSLLDKAKKYKIYDWIALPYDESGLILDNIKGLVHDRHPVVIGALASDQYDSIQKGEIFYGINLPEPLNQIKELPEGVYGHAMIVVGYDDQKSAFKVMNSWGNKWGDDGYFWFDYDSFKNNVPEAYMIVATKPKDQKESKVTPKPAPKPEPEVKSDNTEGLKSPDDMIQVVSNLLLEYECTLVKPVINGNELSLLGFIRDEAGLKKLISQIKTYFIDLKINTSQLFIAPWPTCEMAITAFGASVKSIEKDNLDIQPIKDVFKNKDLLDASINFKKPSGYLNVFYLQADGSAVQVIKDQKINSQNLSLSKLRNEDELIISGPFGSEAMVAIQTPEKDLINLSDDILEDRNFLTQLRIKLFNLIENNQLLSIAPTFLETVE